MRAEKILPRWVPPTYFRYEPIMRDHCFRTASLRTLRLTKVGPLLVLAMALTLQADEKPNIIYILGDDMGYSDIGCYGGEIQTPNLDSLAADGVRFSSFYNMARCCPTRASLLTGLYPHQAGVGWMMSDNGFDGYRGELNRNCVTIAEVLRGAGYKTYMSGKWHVTSKVHPEKGDGKENWPLQRGFDRFYGTIHGAGSFFDPFSLTRDNTYVSPVTDEEYQPENGFYYTDAISDHAVRYIQEHSDSDAQKPFFMYVSYTAAHWPMHAREQDIAKYSGKYDAGYEGIRQARFKRLQKSGLVAPEAIALPKMEDAWKETEHLSWDVRNMEVYAAMVDSMDQGIGRIVESLRRTGQLDNTIIAYLQDNGGCAENYGRSGVGELRAVKPTLPPLADDYLQPDMQPKQTRDGYPVRTGKGVLSGGADTYIGYGRGWATVSNTPFREYKHWVHEGGISTPLIVHWPKGIERTGTIDHTPGHLIDLMATAVDASGAEYPTDFHDGNRIKSMEGKSLLPALAGKEIAERAIFWEHEGNRAIRVGDYKMVAKGAQAAWELYHLASDRSEQNDLAANDPRRVVSMSRQWQMYAQRANVLPLTPYYAARRKAKQTNAASKKLKFSLSFGEELDSSDAPQVARRGANIVAEIDTLADGVLLAHGGVTHGYAVYIQAGLPCFATTRSGERTVTRAESPIMGAGKLQVVWSKKGTVELRWNSALVGKGTGHQPLTQQPQDGLQVGMDKNGLVGDYKSSFPFDGKLKSVRVNLKK